jgi:MFS family permease
MQEAGEHRRGASQGLLTVCLSIGRMVGAALLGGIVTARSVQLDAYREALLYLAIVAAVAAVSSAALRSGSAPAVPAERV